MWRNVILLLFVCFFSCTLAVDWEHLNATTLALLDDSSFANATMENISSIPYHACAGFKDHQIRALNVGGVSGISPACMGLIPVTAVVGFNATQVTHFANQTCSNITSQQMMSLQPVSYSGFTKDCIQAMDISCLGFTKEGIANMTPTAVSGIASLCMGFINESAAGFMKHQVEVFSNDSCHGITHYFLMYLPPAAYSGLTRGCVQNMVSGSCMGYTKDGIANMTTSAISGISDLCMRWINDAAAGFVSDQIAAFESDACKGISARFLESLVPSAYYGFTKACVTQFTDCSGLTKNGITNFNIFSVNGLTTACIEVIPPTAFSGFLQNQTYNFDPNSCFGLNGAQAAIFTPEQVQGFQGTCIYNWDPEVFNNMSMTAIQSFLPTQISSFAKVQVTQFTPATLRKFNITQLGHLDEDGISGITVEQMVQLYDTYKREFVVLYNPVQATAFNGETLLMFKNRLDTKNVSAILLATDPVFSDFVGVQWLTIAAVMDDNISRVLTNSTMGKLDPAGIQGIRKTQVALIEPIAFSKITPSQAANIFPDTMSGIEGTQIMHIPPESFAEIRPIVIPDIPLTAIPDITTDQLSKMNCSQVSALTLDQKAHMSTAQNATFITRLYSCVPQPPMPAPIDPPSLDETEKMYMYIILGVAGLVIIIITAIGVSWLRKRHDYSSL